MLTERITKKMEGAVCTAVGIFVYACLKARNYIQQIVGRKIPPEEKTNFLEKYGDEDW